MTQQNRQGVTPYQLAHKTRAMAAKSRTGKYLDKVFRFFPTIDIVKVQRLLLEAISVNDKDSAGRTGLLVACREGRGDIADLYIELGAHVDVEDAELCDRPCLEFLGCADDKGCTPLHYACGYGWKNTAELLIQRRAKVTASTARGNTALHFACRCRSHFASADVTRLLLHAGAGVNMKNEDGDTPLLLAARNGISDTADLLIHQGADVNVHDKKGHTPLLLDVIKDHTDTADEKGFTPLLWAANTGDTDTADRLIRDGADVNVKDKDGDTPLLLAAMDGDENMVKLLIREGANVNVQNNRGNTPLHLAAMNGRTFVADILLCKRAYRNVQDQRGNTALLLAVMNRYSDTAELLIQRGNTQLLLAALNGHSCIAEVLIRRSAVNIENIDGDTPLLCAVRNYLLDLAYLLISLGAV